MNFAVYIMANKPYGTIYTGQTDHLWRRVAEHKSGAVAGFTKKYGLKRLVYFEMCDTREQAKQREAHIKVWKRDWKTNLIEGVNPKWDDLGAHIDTTVQYVEEWAPAYAGEAVLGSVG